MQVKISIPDDVAEFIINNPNAGRKIISQHFGISDKEARKFAAISQFMKDVDTDAIDEKELDKCKIDADYDIGETGKISVAGKDLSENFSEEGAIKRALEKAKIDLVEWSISKIKIKHWDTTLKLRKRKEDKSFTDIPYHVTHWLVGIELSPNKVKHYYQAFEKLVERTIPISKIKNFKFNSIDGNLCGLLEPADAHIAKHAWDKETLGGNMDLDISLEKFKYGCESDLTKMSMHNLSKIFFVLGHDLIHIDNQSGETTRGGNRLDFDSRFVKIIEETESVLINIIDQATQIAPTKIIWVPGNHDFHASFFLARILNRRYENNKHVEFDIGPSIRKMIIWGDNLIGLVHDAEGRKKVPTVNLLSQYSPWKDHWSKARWTELHTGHLHKRESITIGGTLWRRIAALSTIDAWHADGAYTDAVPCCQSFIYHKKEGIFAEYPTNITYLD